MSGVSGVCIHSVARIRYDSAESASVRSGMVTRYSWLQALVSHKYTTVLETHTIINL
jgi:hypothetical protein